MSNNKSFNLLYNIYIYILLYLPTLSEVTILRNLVVVDYIYTNNNNVCIYALTRFLYINHPMQ